MPLKAAGVSPRTAGRATTRTAKGVTSRSMENANGWTVGTVQTWTARGLTDRTPGVVLGPTRKRVRTRRTERMNDLDIPLVVRFLFFFPEKKPNILQSRMNSSGCQIGDAPTSRRIVSLGEARLVHRPAISKPRLSCASLIHGSVSTKSRRKLPRAKGYCSFSGLALRRLSRRVVWHAFARKCARRAKRLHRVARCSQLLPRRRVRRQLRRRRKHMRRPRQPR